MRGAADPSAQLVELGEAEGVGAVHDQRVHARNVEPRLDDHGRDQHVELAVEELEHHLLEVALVHLPVRDREPHLGHQLLELECGVMDGLDAVVDEEHLAAAVDLAQDRVGDHLGVVLEDLGMDRQAVARRGLDHAHVAGAGEREVERARDRGRGHRQHVHQLGDLAQLLLLGDAEAVLLVDHHQPQVAVLDVLREQAVGADQDVHLALGQLLHHRLLLARGAEAGQHLDLDREVGEPLPEGEQVLLREDRGRHQHRHLAALLHRLEGGAHRHLGLAVADVAADQAVHRLDVLHVLLHLDDRLELVGRLLVGERRLQLALPHGVGLEGVSLEGLPRGVGADQLVRHLLDRLLGARLGLLPRARAEPMHRGTRAFAGRVSRHHRELLHRHEQPVALGVRDLDAIGLLSSRGRRRSRGPRAPRSRRP